MLYSTTLLKTLFFGFLLSCTTVCTKEAKLQQALQLAGENRHELEKVLQHYKEDSLKLKAAKFLITNLVNHRGILAEEANRLDDIYTQHVEISTKHSWERNSAWVREIDSLWKEKQRKGFFIPSTTEDIKIVKSEWLIHEIDRSFKAWQANVYTQNYSFEQFCQYILPHRYANSTVLDHSRDLFYQRHKNVFTNKEKGFKEITDSLHYLYKDIMHNNWAAASLPICSAEAFEKIKRGSCDDRAWYNCFMMSAVGMGCTIDFVPVWGNRSSGHSWNALIVDGETYPFEPFWDDERWKYKRIYNNEQADLLWGRFRLPKVYRRTYQYKIDGPLGYEKDKNNLPPLFRNPNIEDVSKEYFKTSDVEVKLTHANQWQATYCYLCVFATDEWQPVQWGKIEGDRVTFKEMGRDIVYLPMYYHQGSLSVAGNAFLLNQEGEKQEMIPSANKMNIHLRHYSSFLYTEALVESRKLIVGAKLIGYNDLNEAGDTLCMVRDSIEAWGESTPLSIHKAYRYLEVQSVSDSLGLCEITFLNKAGESIPKELIRTSLNPIDSTENWQLLNDGLSATGCKGTTPNKKVKGSLLFDLYQAQTIHSIDWVLYTENYLSGHKNMELKYWDNGWHSAGIVQGETPSVCIKNVPQETIYRLYRKGYKERIFTYKEGMLRWY